MNRTVGLPVQPKAPAPPSKKEGEKNVSNIRGVQQLGRKSTGK